MSAPVMALCNILIWDSLILFLIEAVPLWIMKESLGPERVHENYSGAWWSQRSLKRPRVRSPCATDLIYAQWNRFNWRQ